MNMIDENKLRELGFRGGAVIKRNGSLENAISLMGIRNE